MSTNDPQAALKALLKKTASDADFRAKALKDPAAVLKEAGVELPTGQKIKFVEKLDEVVIALPPLSTGDAELSNEVLEQAAGGAQGTQLSRCGSFACNVAVAAPCTVSWIM